MFKNLFRFTCWDAFELGAHNGSLLLSSFAGSSAMDTTSDSSNNDSTYAASRMCARFFGNPTVPGTFQLFENCRSGRNGTSCVTQLAVVLQHDGILVTLGRGFTCDRTRNCRLQGLVYRTAPLVVDHHRHSRMMPWRYQECYRNGQVALHQNTASSFHNNNDDNNNAYDATTGGTSREVHQVAWFECFVTTNQRSFVLLLLAQDVQD
jgi:hypothetical protein